MGYKLSVTRKSGGDAYTAYNCMNCNCAPAGSYYYDVYARCYNLWGQTTIFGKHTMVFLYAILIMFSNFLSYKLFYAGKIL